MAQEIKNISIKDLVLWTENPRDPIDENATDQDIVNKALLDKSASWKLATLSKEMGEYYDYSELPTVVYHGKKPVVYDGNRRMVLGKIAKQLVDSGNAKVSTLPEFPDEIPCNVCDKRTALKNVLRKHGDTGSWKTLNREYFVHHNFNEPKSPFLILEEETGIISNYPKLNQRFVKEEIFKTETMRELGFDFKNGKLYSPHSKEEALTILSDIAAKVTDDVISTRKERGNLLKVLSPSTKKIVTENEGKELRHTELTFRTDSLDTSGNEKVAKRTRQSLQDLFGTKLTLVSGDVNDIYRDLTDLFVYYKRHKSQLSNSFPNIFRMALRLICEAAAKDKGADLQNYVKGNFEAAKKTLSQEDKTTLHSNDINKETIISLLHTGAHRYKSSSSIEKTIALSLIIGSMLQVTHGRPLSK